MSDIQKSHAIELKQLQLTLDNERNAKLQVLSELERIKHHPLDLAINLDDIPSTTNNEGIIIIIIM